MHRRVARLGGELFIDSREGGGSMIRIRLRWPLGAPP
jgi:signal transduction histidine kinase